ncbi:MAG: CoA pyrophosphatase [Pseudomonadota bacterium]
MAKSGINADTDTLRTGPEALDRDGLVARAQTTLFQDPGSIAFDFVTGRPPVGPSDFELNPDMWAEVDLSKPPREAAVLIPIVATDPLTVILTTRSAHLPSHAGQIAFPGGKIEASDKGPLDAALRETEEEIGLDRSYVRPIGYLDGYRTRTGFRITPVVGLVEPGFSLVADPREVDDMFEVPFAFLMNEVNHKVESKVWNNRSRSFYAMPYNDRYIWGATAGMLKTLHRRLTAR